jgi:cysteinyl-tRNA synthetase
MLKLHNSLTGLKQEFEPLEPGRVRMYVCGITVYDHIHVGHARMLLVFDLVQRYLREQGYAVTYVRNITDIDDKIIERAAVNGESWSDLADRFTAAMHEDCAALGLAPPDIEPRATAYIEPIIAMTRTLIEKGFAYVAEGGDVMYAVRKFAAYGRLSGKKVDDLRSGARVQVDDAKRDPLDFVLWKRAKAHEPAWPSPWGPGRPGWHIECSAMIEQTLGLPIDIHGGGNDLIFPHHENEMAQGLCADHADAYANYWLHNGFVNFGAEKMSKSLGNVQLVHDLVTRVPGEALRWALLASHYRQPLAWSDEVIAQAKNSLDRLYNVLVDAGRAIGEPAEDEAAPLDDPEARAAYDRFEAALMDDLNTPQAFAALFELGDRLRFAIGPGGGDGARSARALLLEAGGQIGFLQADPESWFQGGVDVSLKARIEALIADRVTARATKNWSEADRIRAELTALNVEVMDGPTGATWKIKEQV